MDLLGHLSGRSIAIVLGDGGVGKTTVAAALAAMSAASGRRVLAVTVDPSNRLKDSLGLSGTPGVEEEVPLRDFAPAPGGSLRAMVLDAATELDRVVREASPSDEVRRRITENVFYRKAASRMTGTHEYMAFTRLSDALASGRHDLVVLDTPPERHALDFLDAPARLDSLLGNDAFRLFVSASAGLSRAGLEAIRLRRLVLRGIGRFAGEETFLQVLDFVLAFSPLYEHFRVRAARVKDLFASPACATVLVCRPNPARCPEAGGAGPADALRARGIEPVAVVANRVLVWPPPEAGGAGTGGGGAGPADAASVKDALSSEPALGLYDRDMVSALAGRILGLAGRYRERAEEDAARVTALREAVAPAPVHVVPGLREEVRDLASLARFARVMRGAA
ncbi:MAG: AAA family ATPase [Deltaproteobacteria bacterium]|nr:AAA family ATPase [Deltaproteobacteria bacterium]